MTIYNFKDIQEIILNKKKTQNKTYTKCCDVEEMKNNNIVIVISITVRKENQLPF